MQRDAYNSRTQACQAAAKSAQQELLTVVQQCHSLQLSNAALNCPQLASAIGLEQELQKLVASHPIQPVERSATLFLESSSFSRQLRHVRLRYADAGWSWRFDYRGRSLVVAVRVQVKEGPGKLHHVNADGSLGTHGESSLILRVPESSSTGQWLDVAIVPAPGSSAPISVEVQLMALNTGLMKALQGAAASVLPFVPPVEELQVRLVDVELMQVAIWPVTKSTVARCRRSRPAHSAYQQQEQPISLCGTPDSSP